MDRLHSRVDALALQLTLALLLASTAGCKPGDQAGGTEHNRSQASPKNTPSPSVPEPNPRPDAASAANSGN